MEFSPGASADKDEIEKQFKEIVASFGTVDETNAAFQRIADLERSVVLTGVDSIEYAPDTLSAEKIFHDAQDSLQASTANTLNIVAFSMTSEYRHNSEQWAKDVNLLIDRFSDYAWILLDHDDAIVASTSTELDEKRIMSLAVTMNDDAQKRHQHLCELSFGDSFVFPTIETDDVIDTINAVFDEFSFPETNLESRKIIHSKLVAMYAQSLKKDLLYALSTITDK